MVVDNGKQDLVPSAPSRMGSAPTDGTEYGGITNVYALFPNDIHRSYLLTSAEIYTRIFYNFRFHANSF
jgi:hypothetical protein